MKGYNKELMNSDKLWMLKTDKELKDLLSNENVNIFLYKGKDLYLEIYSYNFNLAEKPQKTEKIFNKIKKYKDDILELYDKDYFIISIEGYSIDGLFESNSLLLFDNSTITRI